MGCLRQQDACVDRLLTVYLVTQSGQDRMYGKCYQDADWLQTVNAVTHRAAIYCSFQLQPLVDSSKMDHAAQLLQLHPPSEGLLLLSWQSATVGGHTNVSEPKDVGSCGYSRMFHPHDLPMPHSKSIHYVSWKI